LRAAGQGPASGPNYRYRYDRARARKTDTIISVWANRDRPSVFYPDVTTGEWPRSVRYIQATEPVHLARLDGSIFARIAELIIEHRKP